MNSIFPDILTDNLDELEKRAKLAQEFSKVLHVDVIDGMYADNLTIGASQLQDVDFGSLEVDVHLMVVDPEDMLGDVHMAKATRVLAQIERMHDVAAYLEKCDEFGLKKGIGLDLYTPVDVLGEWHHKLDVVLLMSVKAGNSGQTFQPIFDKIRDLRKLGYESDIVIDGGLNEETIVACMEAGANQFAVNSSLWQTTDVMQTYQQLQHVVENYE